MQKIPKTFCLAPKSSLLMKTSGQLGPCCRFTSPYSIKDMSIREYFNNDWNKEFYNDMLVGKETQGCQECYISEEKFGHSMRIDINRLFDFTNANDIKKWQDKTYPSKIELQISNLCNLKCLTCSPLDSSSFLTEDKALGISDHDAKNYSLTDQQLETIFEEISKEQIQILDLRGGESLMVPKIKKLLGQLPIASQIELNIQTNGTIFDQEWKNILTKFLRVRVMLSIDAFDSDNLYIRFPADWASILKTINNFRTMSNLSFYINCTVSNLNLPVITKLLDWIKKENIEFVFFFLTSPSYYEMTNLPPAILDHAIEEIKKYRNSKNSENINQQLDSLINYLDNSQNKFNSIQWDNFCKLITKRDNYRKNSIFNINPNLKEYWNDCVT